MIAGRGEEKLAIVSVLDSARAGHGCTLCLVGDPGIGKSTLLRWTCEEAAAGFTITLTSGVETDIAVPYAGLLDLASPLRRWLQEVPDGQRAALEGVLGWEEARPGTPLLVAAAMTSLLSAAAAQAPVLVVVDDLQWLDAESAHALSFAGRRLARERVVFLTARRPSRGHQHPTRSPMTGVAGRVVELPLTGLAPDAAGTLLTAVAPSVRDQLVAATAGNPLALIEVEATLTPAQRRGSAPLPDTLALGQHVLEGFQVTVTGLPAAARRTVFLAAAAHRVATGALVELLHAEGLDAEAALDQASEAGLLSVGGEVTFSHPLQRAAAWAAATPAERRAAHRALSSSRHLTRGIRLRHRIAAASGFDDDLSERVEEWWFAERGRLGYAMGADLLERAADLSSSPDRGASLRARAAEEAVVAGDLERARTLSEMVLHAESPPQARAQASLAAALVEEYAGSVPRSRELLDEASRVGEGLLRVRVLAELGIVAYRLGDSVAMAEAAGRLREIADVTDAEQQMLTSYLTGAAAAFAGRWDQARQPAAQALELLEDDPSLRDDPRYLIHALTAGVWMGEPERALVFVDRREQQARRTGAIGLLPFALTLLSGGAAVLGDHWRAFAYADEAVQLGTELGYVVDVSTAQELLAAQLAARGRHQQAVEALAEARRLGVAAGVADAAVQVELIESYAALCRGDATTAAALLEARLAADGGRLPNGDYELSVAPDLVDAYLALGRSTEATALAHRHAQLHQDSSPPLPRAHARRLVGMTAPEPDSATAAFEAALQEHSNWPDTYEEARTRLAYGARLRRDGQRRAARLQLTSARSTFDALGFTAWSDRTQRELDATGQRSRRGPHRDESLTAQEARVALLVTTGMTNREIAASLFLSPKTVEHHVSAALRKTGVKTRTELALALSSSPAATAHLSAAEVPEAVEDSTIP